MFTIMKKIPQKRWFYLENCRMAVCVRGIYYRSSEGFRNLLGNKQKKNNFKQISFPRAFSLTTFSKYGQTQVLKKRILKVCRIWWGDVQPWLHQQPSGPCELWTVQWLETATDSASLVPNTSSRQIVLPPKEGNLIFSEHPREVVKEGVPPCPHPSPLPSYSPPPRLSGHQPGRGKRATA